MLSQVLWWVENLLLGLLLARSVTGRFFTKYAVFYSYVSYVLLESLLRFYVYIMHPSHYASFYWYTEFLSVALGYCIIWEIHGQALAAYPGAARLGRVLLLVVFIAVVAEALTGTLSAQALLPSQIPAVLERNLRAAQATLLAAIVALLLYYGIPVGQNLRGMIVGYGLFIVASVVSLTLRSHLGKAFQPWWQYLQLAAYLAALLVWCGTLWSYQPNPKPAPDTELERDYDRLSSETAKAIAWARSYLVRVVRP